jgi:hypothetical protein
MLKHVLSLLAAGSLLAISAASPSIGFVKSGGEFRVDGSAVRGNGTVFEGALVETSSARSVIQLTGAQIILSPDSRVRVYRDRTVLEKGSSLVKDVDRHVIEAATLHIAPTARDSVVQIDIMSPSHVRVAASGGAAEVRNSSGILTASLRPGMALAFEPQAAAAAAVKMTGVIESRNGTYFLTDETTKVTIQLLEGAEVSKYVGKKVEVTGSSIPGASPAGGASQLVRAVTIKPVGGKGKAGAVAAAGAGAGAAGGAAGSAAAGGGAAAGAAAGAAGAGAAAGLSGAAVGAIVGGVAVGGTVGGLAASGTFSSDPSVSRQ